MEYHIMIKQKKEIFRIVRDNKYTGGIDGLRTEVVKADDFDPSREAEYFRQEEIYRHDPEPLSSHYRGFNLGQHPTKWIGKKHKKIEWKALKTIHQDALNLSGITEYKLDDYIYDAKVRYNDDEGRMEVLLASDKPEKIKMDKESKDSMEKFYLYEELVQLHSRGIHSDPRMVDGVFNPNVPTNKEIKKSIFTRFKNWITGVK